MYELITEQYDFQQLMNQTDNNDLKVLFIFWLFYSKRIGVPLNQAKDARLYEKCI